ncbi:MAG: carbamoyltransferase [Acidobacteriia bacterium]|nr:carbamoyltransferase [Terriglobia bacterium]
MNILGVSCYYHDSAAALIQNGKLAAASEEERFSRRKHDCGFPTRAIEFCLRFAGISSRDLDYVVFYEKPFLKLERILFTSLGVFPRSWNIFREASISWMQDRLWVKNRLVESLPVPADRVLFVDHHLAHAASAFFCSPFTEAAILTVDGVGEWATSTIGRATAKWDRTGSNSIQLTHELRFPHSLGLLYSAFTGFLGFEVNEGEYKVMGMSCYGQPRYLDRIAKLASVNDDGSLSLDLDYFSYHYSAVRSYNRRFLDLFGPPRDPHSEFSVADGSSSTQESQRNQYYADVAASIQRFTEDVLLKMACHVQRATGLKQLCMAGGVALNSMANARILRETPFEDLFIQPAAGDSGGAVGAALYAWHVLLGHDREFVLENAYLGSSYEEADIARAIGDAPHQRYDDSAALVERVVQELEAGKVVGWFQGRGEWGPRALGNRSILADPRSAAMKDTINRKIKFREPFRPFAPVVAEQDASRFFDGLPDVARQYPARYMLLVLPWKPGAAETVPAVNHMGTGRVQTLRREWNPLYYDALDQFGQATGTPVLLNTSFNLRGEPIVCSPVDACRTFRNSGLDLLVLNNFVVVK